jgi:hypothetical protein
MRDGAGSLSSYAEIESLGSQPLGVVSYFGPG